jgi:calcium-dependent protein kinase
MTSTVKQDVAMSALTNLQNFNAQSKLKQATYAFIASQLLSKNEKEQIDKIFRAMDENGDGVLSKEEIKKGY